MANNHGNYVRQDEEGKKSEKRYKRYAESKGFQIEDLRSNHKKWGWYGDFKVLNQFVEVKSDKQILLWHNIFLEDEIIRDNYGPCEGWWRHLKADYLCFDSGLEHVLIFIDFKYLKENFDGLSFRYKKDVWNEKEEAYCNGYLVPIEELCKYGIIKKFVEYEEVDCDRYEFHPISYEDYVKRHPQKKGLRPYNIPSLPYPF